MAKSKSLVKDYMTKNVVTGITTNNNRRSY